MPRRWTPPRPPSWTPCRRAPSASSGNAAIRARASPPTATRRPPSPVSPRPASPSRPIPSARSAASCPGPRPPSARCAPCTSSGARPRARKPAAARATTASSITSSIRRAAIASARGAVHGRHGAAHLGALFCQSYFDGESAAEAEIRALADSLYFRADWQWASVRPPTIGHGWTPEAGHLPYDWRGYNEAMLVYLLALGSPTHSVAPEAWSAWLAGYRWGEFQGQRAAGLRAALRPPVHGGVDRLPRHRRCGPARPTASTTSRTRAAPRSPSTTMRWRIRAAGRATAPGCGD